MIKYLLSAFLLFNFYISQATTCLTITFTDQASVNAFASTGCDTIMGNLIIEPNLASFVSITDLSPLSSLVHVTGTITIRSNPALTSLDGLSNLQSTTELFILSNPVLNDISALSNLTLSFNLEIDSNPALSTCCVFKSQILGLSGVKLSGNGANCNTDTAIAADTACDVITPPVKPVPTIGEWGLIILSLMCMIIGTIAVNERKTIKI